MRLEVWLRAAISSLSWHLPFCYLNNLSHYKSKVHLPSCSVGSNTVLQNTRPDFSELNVGPTVRSARSVKQQSRVAKTTLFLGPTNAIWTVRVFGFVKQLASLCQKNNVFFQHTAIEHKINMALQKFAPGTTHYCKFKHTALFENALLYDNKTTINEPILCRFQNDFFQRSKNWNTPFYLQMFCALSGRSLSWNTPFQPFYL